MENKDLVKQTLCLEGVSRLSLSGVVAVDCVSTERIRLSVKTGKLNIGGEKLKVNNFSEGTGAFCCEGVINSLAFSKGKQNIIKRLFK